MEFIRFIDLPEGARFRYKGLLYIKQPFSQALGSEGQPMMFPSDTAVEPVDASSVPTTPPPAAGPLPNADY